MKYKLLLLFLAIFMAQSSFAQTQTVKGTVVDRSRWTEVLKVLLLTSMASI